MKKNKTVALILCVSLGYLGVHRFYLGKTRSGILYLLTLGVFGFGWVYDIFCLIKDVLNKQSLLHANITSSRQFQSPAIENDFDIKACKVVGVTFKNEDKSNRQTILRKLRFNDPPFDKQVDFSLRQYEYDGSPAVAVFANEMQIGSLSKDDSPYILENWEKILGVVNFEVHGGGKTNDGEKINYGCTIMIKVNKRS